jgi:hypothetical protein
MLRQARYRQGGCAPPGGITAVLIEIIAQVAQAVI